MDWFERLVGFGEGDYAETQSKFAVDGARLTSRVNGRSWSIGEFETVPLADLRRLAATSGAPHGKTTLHLVPGDVRKMHAMPEYAGALFQVASQFNALEMVGPDVTPEDGVTRYQHDRTQGPACALAAAPATIFRNYFVPQGGAVGQTRDRQLDGLAEVGLALGAALGHPVTDLWDMRNGYALCSRAGLNAISAHLSALDGNAIDDLRDRLSIAIQRGVEVTESGAPEAHLVSQAFCSALPVAYTRVPSALWKPFATLVLEAAYEATLLEAVINAARGVSNIVLLTLLGGGAFGNDAGWIYQAIRRALTTVVTAGLDVRIVSYGRPSPDLVEFVARLRR
jgi:hypothetical protein